MSSIVIAGDTSGSVTLQAPAVAGSTVLNLPATSGTIQTSGAGYTTNGVAYASSTSALTTGSALTFDGTNLGVGADVGVNPNNGLTRSWGNTKRFAWMSFDSSYYMEINADAANRAINYTVNSGDGTAKHLWNIGTAGTPSEAMRLNSTGLGIGTSSPASKLDVSGDIIGRATTLRFKDSGNTTQYGAIYGDSTTFNINAGVNNLVLYSAGTERARIDYNGALLIGVTTASTTLSQEIKYTTGQTGTRYINASSSNSYAIQFVANSALVGSITTSGSTTTYATSSDYRLKNTITPMIGALAKVAQLKPVTYKWNANGSDGQGFIAHELAEVCPDAVVGEKDAVDEDGNPKYQGIDTSFLVATLTAAIQEQQALITALTDRISVLENK